MSVHVNLAEIQDAVNGADKLKILNATLEKSRRSQALITIDNAAAGELIETIRSGRASVELVATVWRFFVRCCENELLAAYCEEILYSEVAPATWREYAFSYLWGRSQGGLRARYIDYAESSAECRLRFAAAVRCIDVDPVGALKRIIDVCECRDPYDHGTFEAASFWIRSRGDSSLVRYMEEKLKHSNNPDVRSDLSDWIEMLSDSN